MIPFSLPAPAKLNLFLHVTGRRADGYHSLETLFVLLDHGDTLFFAPAPDLRLEVDGGAPGGEDNLVLRAARLLQRHTGCRQGARLRLVKRLPEGGGVGGGSSDAASALLGLDYLWGLNLGLEVLAGMALPLGADVPVFVQGESAWAEGVGEVLVPVRLEEQWYLVIHPGLGISTARIFADPQLTRDTPKSRVAAFLEPGSAARFHNDCEPIARRLFPAVGDALDWLREHAGNSRMTGTGACVFARIADRRSGDELLHRLPADWTGFIARSTNRSPAHVALESLRRAG